MAERGRDRTRADTIDPRGATGRAQPWAELRWDWLTRAWLWLRAQVRAEAERALLLPWIAVAFGFGIALYFAAEREPSLIAATATSLIFITAAFLARRTRGFVGLALVAAAACGFAEGVRLTCDP